MSPIITLRVSAPVSPGVGRGKTVACFETGVREIEEPKQARSEIYSLNHCAVSSTQTDLSSVTHSNLKSPFPRQQNNQETLLTGSMTSSKSSTSMKVSVSTTLDETLAGQIRFLAEQRGLPPSYIIRESIEKGFPGVAKTFHGPVKFNIKSNGRKKV